MSSSDLVKILCSSLDHEHAEVEEEVDWGLTGDTKLAVEHVYIMGTKTAQAIIYALRNREILERLPENIDRSKIKEPSLKQLENYI